MATRNLTSRFENLRAQRQQRSFSPYDRSAARDDGFPLLSEQGPSLPPSLPPRWVDEVDRFQETVSKIKANMKELSKLHAQRLNEKFSEDKAAHLDNQIGVYTTETSAMFSEAQNRIKCIALVGNDSHLSFQERTVRLNVMRHLGGDIQAMSKEFRKMQKDFMYRMKGLDELGDYLGDSDEKSEGSIRAMLDEDNMSAKAKGQLSLLLKEGTEREKQIASLLVSINELNTIFRDLNTLVIEQGSILDRIDYNVEQALTKTKEGTAQLVKAEKRSRHARSLICIGLLIVIIAILSGILYYKKH